jgi:putative DNA primase/helicase
VDFFHIDDEEFAILRRKVARWAADNAVAIRGSTPTLPTNFGNRLAANWHVLLAIAELADGNWPQQAREAAERLSRTARKPSLGVQLLAAFQTMFATGRREITSNEVVAELLSDPDAPWTEYRGGPITQRQVADLLEQYDISPVVIHPTRRASLSRRG